VRSVAVSPDGQTIVSGSSDKMVKLWEASTGLLLRTLKGHRDWVRSVAVSPDGRTIVSGGVDNTVKFWEASTGRLLRTLEGHGSEVNSVAVSPDGRWLVSSGCEIYDGAKHTCTRGDIKLWTMP